MSSALDIAWAVWWFIYLGGFFVIAFRVRKRLNLGFGEMAWSLVGWWPTIKLFFMLVLWPFSWGQREAWFLRYSPVADARRAAA